MTDAHRATEAGSLPTVGHVWQNLRSGRLVTVRAVDRALDQVTYKYSTGIVRSLDANRFLFLYRHESEIRP